MILRGCFFPSLTLYKPTPQNGQTNSNNSSAMQTNCLNVFDHFMGVALKGLTREYSLGSCEG